MNEQEWLACDSFVALLDEAAGRPGVLSERRLLLVGDALLFGVKPDRPGAWLPKWAGTERCQEDLARACAVLREIVGNPFRPVTLPCECHCGRRERWPATGECPDCGSEGWCPWLTPQVLALAHAAYECVEDGTLDPFRLALVADALEEGGCTDPAVLDHLRGETCPYCRDADFSRGDYGGPIMNQRLRAGLAARCACGGSRRLQKPHVRGCHILDLLLGRA